MTGYGPTPIRRCLDEKKYLIEMNAFFLCYDIVKPIGNLFSKNILKIFSNR